MSSYKKYVVLAGNPNVGKTTLFNQLTGRKQKVANYPGVTVEKHEGEISLAENQSAFLVDLPGTYSLNTQSEDEGIAADVISGQLAHSPKPDVVLVVVEASKLNRGLLLFKQIQAIHPQVVLVVNMMDELSEFGLELDVNALIQKLGVPVFPIVAKNGKGIEALRDRLSRYDSLPANRDGQNIKSKKEAIDPEFVKQIYKDNDQICQTVFKKISQPKDSFSDKLDLFLLHPVLGPLIFAVIILFFFQALFSWSAPLIDFVDEGFASLAGLVSESISTPWLASLIADGVIGGVGSVLVFVPQIAITFFLIGILEMTGYLSRGAFLIDRFLRLFGLEGRAFIPLISSFACAIPGIMATRSMPHARQRLITILVAPLMTCSARLPVYTLLIATFIPATTFMGVMTYQGLTLFSLFVAGIVMGLIMSLVFHFFLPKKGLNHSFFMELPRYRVPTFKNLYNYVWPRTRSFIMAAGSVIFVLSLILWALAYFPHSDSIKQKYDAQKTELQSQNLSDEVLEEKLVVIENNQAGEWVETSYLGQLGQFFEPAFKPLGFDWKITTAVLSSFAAREVFVSSMGVIYHLGEVDEESKGLSEILRTSKDSKGQPLYTMATALSLLVFFAFAAQCISTLGVIKRETGGLKWPIFSFLYMTTLAYCCAWAVYHFYKS